MMNIILIWKVINDKGNLFKVSCIILIMKYNNNKMYYNDQINCLWNIFKVVKKNECYFSKLDSILCK